MEFRATPVAYVESTRKEPLDDDWSRETSSIVLTDDYDESALQGIEDYSHVEVTFCFHRVDPAEVVRGARHPRGNPGFPLTGIFAQRAKNRPNRIGHTTCRLVKREGRRLHVVDLDCIDGTPVLDLKPAVRAFQPREEVSQPRWVDELTRDYWATSRGPAPARLRRIALRAHHVESLAEFYSAVFGMRFESSKTSGMPCFVGRLGDVVLQLVPLRDASDFEGFPLHQLGFDVQDVDEAVQSVLELGGRLEEEVVRKDDRAHACVRDPDGNTIELFGPAAG
ncbi:MAG: SAM-dependent methyltransferase [Planctomycetes bacterium]|nr:SAM-dependent methyltransferase [Planctomycetota bacterium]MCB9905522.1 SAM-dependent methyltransferase [Planctomycetota bacterium]